MFKNKLNIRIIDALAISIISMAIFSGCEKEDLDLHNYIINDVVYPKNSNLKQISYVESVKSKETGMIAKQYEYDAEGKISKISEPMYEEGTPLFENGTIVGVVAYSDYVYNSKGQLMKVTNYHSNINSSFLNLSTQTYTYDSDGKKQKEVIEYPQMLQNRVDSTVYFYDKNRLTREEKYEDGYFGSQTWHSELVRYIEYKYDNQGKLAKETIFSGAGNPLQFSVHTYQDGLNVRTEVFRTNNDEKIREIRRYFDKNENLIYLESREYYMYSSSMSYVAKYEY